MQNAAGDTIDKCLERLGLASTKSEPASDWAAMLAAERTPAAAFGLSHFVVLRKRSATA